MRHCPISWLWLKLELEFLQLKQWVWVEIPHGTFRVTAATPPNIPRPQSVPFSDGEERGQLDPHGGLYGLLMTSPASPSTAEKGASAA